jgi:hypothetical protein
MLETPQGNVAAPTAGMSVAYRLADCGGIVL